MYGTVLQKLGASYDPAKIKGQYPPNSQTLFANLTPS
jgi:hypothetical protein